MITTPAEVTTASGTRLDGSSTKSLTCLAVLTSTPTHATSPSAPCKRRTFSPRNTTHCCTIGQSSRPSSPIRRMGVSSSTRWCVAWSKSTTLAHGHVESSSSTMRRIHGGSVNSRASASPFAPCISAFASMILKDRLR